MLEDPAARISTLLDCLNAVEEAHTALEFRFRETIGLARALEAVELLAGRRRDRRAHPEGLRGDARHLPGARQ